MADFHDLLLRKLSSSASLSKNRHSNGNGGADALGASPTFSIPHFAVDYGEMFGTFLARKGPASIPVLDFQLVDDCDDFSVDVWNSNFNYSEVFGGFDSEDFAVYYEEMLAENISEIPQVPAEAGSKQQVPVFVPRIPTEELNGERFAGSDKSNVPSDAILYDMHNCVNKSDVSLDEASGKSERHSMDELTRTAHCYEDSGYQSVADGCSPSHISRYEKTKSQVADDPGLNVDFNGRSKGKDAKGTFLVASLGNELKADREQLGHKRTIVKDASPTDQCHFGHPESGGNQSYTDKAFLTISDINLQTQPLEVPPPSRPPPKIIVKQEDSKRMVTRSRKPYSEIDASSAAVVSVAAMREAMDKAQASLKCAKESMGRKQDNIESHIKLCFDRQRKVDERSEGATAQKDHKFREDLSEEECKRDTSKTKDFTGFEKSTAVRPGHAAPDTEDKWGFIELGKESIVKRVGHDYRLMPQCSRMEGREQEWKAENQFDGPEKSEKSNSQDAAANGENPKWRATDKVQVGGPHETKVARKPVELEKNDKSRVIQEDCMWEGKNCKLKVSHELEENVIKTKAAPEAYEKEENEVKVSHELEENVIKTKAAPEAYEKKENEVKVEVACRYGDMKSSVAKEVCKFVENEKNLYEDKQANIEQVKESELRTTQIIHLEGEYEKKLTTSVKHEREALKLNTTEEACQFDIRTEELKVTKMAFREDENKKGPETGQVIHDDDSSLKSAEDAIDWELNEKKTKVAEEDSDCAENEKETKMDEIACEHEKNKKKSEEAEVAHWECWNKQTLEKTQDFCQEDEKKLKAAHDVNGEWKNNQKVKTCEVVQQDGHGEKLGVAEEVHKREDNEIMLRPDKVSSVKVKIEKLKTTEMAHEVVADKKNSWQDLAVLDQLSNKSKFKAAQEVFRRLESGKKSEATQRENPLKEREDIFQATLDVVLNPIGGRKEDNDCGMHEIEEHKGGSMPKERYLEKEWLRSVEGRESERERIKDWLAAGRIALKSGDVAVAGAQKMAESVIMERACVKVQTPEVVSQEREASAEACQKSLEEEVYVEVRVPAEQAAILREAFDAQEHAMERTFSEPAISGEIDQVERSTTEKFNVSGNNEMEESLELSDEADNVFKQGFSSTDVEYFASGPKIQSSTSCKSFQQHPNSAADGALCSDEKFQGADGESSTRFKARLARHQRMLERVAKVLAEKNLRDILAQRELAERSRLAETLDAEVRRWSSGKEGNLRALLSTLQYILGPESGWKPIPLTDVITAVAVKKAYKKAALYVHPDKVQQRRATIQQKYICEKVFDLLKEAWNTFNSEER